MTWKDILVVLNTVDGIQPAQLEAMRHLYEKHGALPDAHGLVQAVGLRQRVAKRISQTDPQEIIRSEKEAAEAQGFKIITCEDPMYPEPLKGIFAPPTVLYMKGKYLPKDEMAIAIVGS